MRQSITLPRCAAIKKLSGKPCRALATMCVDGVNYCGTHDPLVIAARTDARQRARAKRGAAQIAERDKAAQRLALANELVGLVVARADANYCDWIAKWKTVAKGENHDR